MCSMSCVVCHQVSHLPYLILRSWLILHMCALWVCCVATRIRVLWYVVYVCCIVWWGLPPFLLRLWLILSSCALYALCLWGCVYEGVVDDGVWVCMCWMYCVYVSCLWGCVVCPWGCVYEGVSVSKCRMECVMSHVTHDTHVMSHVTHDTHVMSHVTHDTHVMSHVTHMTHV